MSITVQVELDWLKCVVAKSYKYSKIPSSWNEYGVSRSTSPSAALTLIFQ